MQINLSFDASVKNAPAGFMPAIEDAAQILDTMITNNVTVTINVGYGEIGGAAIPANDLAEGGPLLGTDLSYQTLVADLAANGDPTEQGILAALPANASSQILSGLYVSPTQQAVFGLIGNDVATPAGQIGFSSTLPFDYNLSDQAVAGEYSILSVAEHELTHALGRTTDDGGLLLANYSAPGVLANSTVRTAPTPGYFSVNGGVTNLGTYASFAADPTDWATTSAVSGDAFAGATAPDVAGTITAVDQRELSALGFTINPSAPGNFLVTTAGSAPGYGVSGVPYSGPVQGLQWQLLYPGNQPAFDITATTSNTFIATGSGEDAISVALANGNNVLDGGTGSNFMTGGTGNDTFFVDDRSPTSDIWSTIAGAHAGDSVTVWGITPADFSLKWLNNQGAAGATGLTLSAASPNTPDVNMTLAGFSTADLADNKLVVSYGTTPNEPGLPGSIYMQISVT